MATEMCVWHSQSVSSYYRGCGVCGEGVEACKLPPIVYVAVSLKVSTTQPCSVISCAASPHLSEYIALSAMPWPVTLCGARSPWTLAVAVVLLPVIAKLLGSLREPAQLTVLAAVADMVVKRFSPSILSCKSEFLFSNCHSIVFFPMTEGNKSRRISSTADLQQKRLCYNELHNAWVAIGQRPKSGRIADDKEVVNLLSDLQKTLSPFRNELPAT